MRIAVVAFVGSQATLVFNTYKVDPANPSGATVPAQSRREFTGENSAEQALAFARKVCGVKSDAKAHALRVADGIYSIELGDAPAPAKSK
jgi:hypothetical protein